MRVFGQYQSGQELFHTASTSVFTAARSESAVETVIKVFEPDPVFIDRAQIATQVEGFLAAAALQQGVAGSGSAHWAPVHDLAQIPDGAYYVVSRYPLSAQGTS